MLKNGKEQTNIEKDARNLNMVMDKGLHLARFLLFILQLP
jgi:hypothetical protein